MLAFLRDLRHEVLPMTRLAIPIVVAELGWVAMGVVDTLMVGRLSPEALGSVSIGRVMLMVVCTFGIGTLLGLDTVVSQAFGGGRIKECHRFLVQGVYLSVILAVPSIVVVRAASLLFDNVGVDLSVAVLAKGYINGVSWGVLPILLYTTFRRYLQAQNIVRPVMVALVSANLVNAFANWVLIYGNLGAPALGPEGAGWATTICSAYMAAFLLVTVIVGERRDRTGLFATPLRLDGARLRRILGLGIPVGFQIAIEIGVIAVATWLIGRIGPTSLAAHQIGLTLAGVTFMVPLGVSSAAAVRVGQALGRGDARGASCAGWTGLLLGGGFMLVAAATYCLVPGVLVSLFTPDARVIAVGTGVLFVAGVFQLFDGLQIVAGGALRGAGSTKLPMVSNLVGHWLLGLPVGWALSTWLHWGVVGVWMGLCTGLIAVAIILVAVWCAKVREWR